MDENEWKQITRKKGSKLQKKSDKVAEFSTKDNVKLDEFNREIISNISSLVERQPKILVIMRGLPGSGKSTLAK